MRPIYFLLSILFLLVGVSHISSGQVIFDKIVQINGVVMTSDSLYGIPDVTVSVKNQNKGTYTSEQGVFALVCFKGDTLQFRSLGFEAKEYVVPQNIKSNSISMVQLLSQDTFFFSETIIHALPSKENFNYAFQNLNIDDDKYEIARKNSNLAMMRMLAMTALPDGHENGKRVMNDIAYRAAYQGQQQPMNILSPIKWGQFIEAWKRGDFRKKKSSKY